MGDDKKLHDLQEQIKSNSIYRVRVNDLGTSFELQEFLGEATESVLENFRVFLNLCGQKYDNKIRQREVYSILE